MSDKSRVRRSFDRAFFQRYYHSPRTAVASFDDVMKRARFVTSYLDHLQVDVRRVLDAGCGTGMWKRALARIDRDIEYVGIDASEYLCQRHGWTQASIDEFRSPRKFDLVVCQDVLQYVDAAAVEKSFTSIARLCRGALYFDVPTRDDIDDGLLDMRLTDRSIHIRSAAWYRARLARQFVEVGGGVFVKRNAKAVVLALERCGARRARKRAR
ncbi:MAG TPA: class I SAM-dependent methyltransferase [Candidatus Krumholzibacteria bacterium]|nr:class I SAM-dependent methyltransferase [Candidatus Krumholzibacteria bacterium]